MGCGESGRYVFCVRGAGGAGGGDGEGAEERVFGVGEEVAEGEWEFWRGDWERGRGGGGRGYEVLLLGGCDEVVSEEGGGDGRGGGY